MANSRIMLVCKHCGQSMVLGKGYYGSYCTFGNMTDKLNEFFEEHEMGICSEDADCSDDAKNHFAILEEGDTLEDLSDEKAKQEVAKQIFEEIEQKCLFEEIVGCSEAKLLDEEAYAELKKKYIGE